MPKTPMQLLANPEPKPSPMEKVQLRMPPELKNRLDRCVDDYHEAGAPEVTASVLMRSAITSFIEAHEEVMMSHRSA